MVAFGVRPPAPQQSLSAELEFHAFVDYMVQHCNRVRNAQEDDAGELVEPEFDLAVLEGMIMQNFQKRDKAEFTRDSAFADHWIISKYHLKKGKWKKALTFAKAHEGLIFGHFKGKSLPESSVSALGGVDVATWDDLLQNNSKNPYWNTKRTLADYAMENKELILALKDVDLDKNSGKVVRLGDKTLYVANVDIDKESHMIFSFVNKLKVDGFLSRLFKRVYNY